jgi:hypothetical protein
MIREDSKCSKKYRVAVVAMLAVFALGSCATDSGVSAVEGTEAAVCMASSAWIDNPSLPREVAPGQSNCDFHRFMWQSLLFLVQPIRQGSRVRQFETYMPSYGLFVGPGKKPAEWGTVPKPVYCQGVNPPDAGYIFSDLTLQAGAHLPLIDRSLNDVFYNVSVNAPAYQFITACDLYKAQCSLTLAPDLLMPGGMRIVDIPKQYPRLAFPDQSIELKTSWKILTATEIAGQTFYTTKGAVKAPGKDCLKDVTLGLVGMHIVTKTPTHPEFIWATFEHKNNAPDCANTNAQPPLGGNWTFYDQNCKNCTTNEYVKGKATQLCRMHPWGNPVAGTFPNNLNCNSVPPPAYICDAEVRKNIIEPNTANLKTLNASVMAMLRRLPVGNANRLWANYELVGNVWTVNGALPPYLQAQRGSLASANTTMESYVQNGVSNITNPNSCFSCHNLDGKTKVTSWDQASRPVTLPPAGLAHIFNLLDVTSTGCNNGTSLPATPACSVYHK